MGIIKDIDELNKTEKSFVIGIPILTVFWFISIYLFNFQFFKGNDLYIILSFSFVLAICWFIANVVLNFTFLPKIDEDFDAESGFITTVITSIIYLSIIIFISYLLKEKKKTKSQILILTNLLLVHFHIF